MDRFLAANIFMCLQNRQYRAVVQSKCSWCSSYLYGSFETRKYLKASSGTSRLLTPEFRHIAAYQHPLFAVQLESYFTW